MTVLPTRKESIKSAAKNEFDQYTETSFVRTGNSARDRQRMLEKELAKPRSATTAQWNPDTQGNRRACIYDPCGRSNPKWQYVKGRNPFRSKVGFQKDDFEDLWAIIAKPEACGPGISITIIRCVHIACSKHCVRMSMTLDIADDPGEHPAPAIKFVCMQSGGSVCYS